MNNLLDSVEAHFGKTVEWKLSLSEEWQENHVAAGPQTFWSPIFSLAGAQGLQVEARLRYQLHSWYLGYI